MYVRSTTAWTRELKPFEAPFLQNDFSWFSGLKYQILKYFENQFKTTEVRPEVYEKSEKQKMFI